MLGRGSGAQTQWGGASTPLTGTTAGRHCCCSVLVKCHSCLPANSHCRLSVCSMAVAEWSKLSKEQKEAITKKCELKFVTA